MDINENMSKLVSCLQDIHKWLITNMLSKNNGPKTEFSLHGTLQQLAKLKDASLILIE